MSGEKGKTCHLDRPQVCLEGNDKIPANVLYPPTYWDHSVNYATLYSSDSEAAEKWAKIARFKAIDPKEDFCYFPVGKCRTALTEPLIRDCDRGDRSVSFRQKRRVSDEVTQIVDENKNLEPLYKGGDVDEIVHDLKDIVMFGLPKMAQAELVHMNITPSTIVRSYYDQDDDDWGMNRYYGACHFNSYDKSRQFNDLTVDSPDLKWNKIYPPEYNELREDRVLLRDANADLLESIGIPSTDSKVVQVDDGRVYSKFKLEWAKLLASGKSSNYLGKLLLFDKIDIYSLGILAAELLNRKRRVNLSNQKLKIWVAQVTRSNPLLRWSPSISAAFWPYIGNKTISYEAALEFAAALTEEEAKQVKEIIRANVFNGTSEAGAGTSGGAAADSKAAGGRAYKRKSKSRSKRMRNKSRGSSIKRKKSPRRTVRR